MRRLISMTIAGVLLASVVVAAEQPGKQKKQQNGKKAATVQSGGGTDVAVHVSFTTGDVELIRRHYAPRYRNLPPGLQKKVARGGSLPPGWQKKLEPFPLPLERGLPPLPAGYWRGVFDAHAVIYNSKGMIIDVAVLF